jgi:hypothetical protein
MGGMSLAPFRGCGVSDCAPAVGHQGGVCVEVERCWFPAQPCFTRFAGHFGVGMLPLSRSSNTGEEGPPSGPDESSS